MPTPLNSLKSIVATALFDMPVLTESQEFNQTGFDQLSIASGIDGEIVVGPEFSIIAKASHAVALENLTLSQKGTALKISCDTKLGGLLPFDRKAVFLTITMPTLLGVRATSGSDIRITGQFSDTFSASASSGASLEITDLNTTTVDLNASSGADIMVAGSCRFLAANASSGADINAKNLICNAIEVAASSGADVRVFSNKVLDSSASSGGEIRAFGGPLEADIHDSTGGETDLRN